MKARAEVRGSVESYASIAVGRIELSFLELFHMAMKNTRTAKSEAT